MESLEKYKAVLILRKAFSSLYFPIVSVAVFIACYYLALDIVAIWYASICCVGIMLCCRDVTPAFSVFVLLPVIISLQHSPSILWGEPSDYFTRPAILTLAIIAITAFVGTAIFRLIESIVHRRFKISHTFIGLAVFVAAMFFNGAFAAQYTVMNVVYALFLAVMFLCIFSFGVGNIQLNEQTYKRIAFYFLALLAVLTVEIVVAYITYEGLIVDGVVDRGRLYFGWGTYNNAGALLMLCLPAGFYLAGKYKHGWAFSIVALLNLLLIFLSMSRQAILMGTILFGVCFVWMMFTTKGYPRLVCALIVLAAVSAVAIVFAASREWLERFFSSLMQSLETGSTRTVIWKEGIDKFLHYPIFGAGFYCKMPWVWGQSGFADILPRMYHNTIVELLATNGLVGLLAYAGHRVQTVVSLVKNFNHERFYIALTIAGLLLVSLLDNHIFYLFPTIIYAMLLAVLDLSEKKKPQDKPTAEKIAQ